MEYSETEKCYVATVEALKTGTTVITVRATVRKTVDNQEIELEYQASFTLTVTADLTVYSDSAEIKGELHQTSDKITLYAVPTSQALSVKEAGSSGSTAEVHQMAVEWQLKRMRHKVKKAVFQWNLWKPTWTQEIWMM